MIKQLIVHVQSALTAFIFRFYSVVIWPFQSPVFIVLIGGPGSGKGTVGGGLAAHFGVPGCSTGEVFRHLLKDLSAIGQLVAPYMAKGDLAPDDITFAVMLKELRKWRYRRGAILDGFPRNVGQAQLLAGFLQKYGIKLRAVVVLDVPQEELLKRLMARRRDDDLPEVIENRLTVYYRDSGPMVPYYADHGPLTVVALPPTAKKEEVLQYVLAKI